jgi:hypothetical protein
MFCEKRPNLASEHIKHFDDHERCHWKAKLDSRAGIEWIRIIGQKRKPTWDLQYIVHNEIGNAAGLEGAPKDITRIRRHGRDLPNFSGSLEMDRAHEEGVAPGRIMWWRGESSLQNDPIPTGWQTYN